MIKKVMFITNVYPNEKEPFRGVYIQNRAKQLTLNGIDTKVSFLTRTPAKCIDAYSHNYLYANDGNKLNYINLGKNPGIEEIFFNDLANFSPDLIIFCVTSMWIKKEIIKKAPNFKYANFFEGRNADGQYQDHKLYNLLIKSHEKSIYKKMNYLLFCSSLSHQDFIQKFPMIDQAKCHTLTNGFDIETFNPVKKHVFNTNEVKIITVGNIAPAKGQLLLAEAISQVAPSSDKHIVFELIGTGKEESINKINQIVCDKNVTFIYKNMLTQSELVQELQDYDFFILPSYFESFGCVYLEAMSQGLITVGCENQGPSIYIENEINGYLVKENNIESIAKLLRCIIDKGFNYDRISQKAILTAKQYGWERFGKDFKKLFS